MKTRTLLIVLTVLALPALGLGEDLTVTVENLQPEGGLSFTPFWLAVQDGTFDAFDEGAAASSELTAIAELGDTSPMSSLLSAAQPGAVETTFASSAGAPVFSPGESENVLLNVSDPTTNRYLNYASMVVPSNDLFVGNDSPLELFDAGGNYLGDKEILIYGRSVWDAGTEVNDITDGAAFLQGVDGTAGTDEIALITMLDADGDDAAYLASIVGETTATGTTITNVPGSGDLIGRVIITPEPATMGLLAFGGLALIRRRRK